MRQTVTLLAVLLLSVAGNSVAAETAGLVRVASPHDVTTTADRLERVLGEKGMTVFARIDHAAGAAGAGLSLRPTTLVLFGNPRIGTGLMNCAQTAGIDLPMKALIWQDADGAVWLAYNAAAWLGERHQLGEACAGLLDKVSKALSGFAAAATAP